MLKLAKIAVTGGLSCGKSTVCQIFQQLGAKWVSADEIVHQLLTPESQPGQKVIEWLGPSILHEGKIDRGAIATLVFSDPTKVKTLESLLHPYVGMAIRQAYDEASKNPLCPLFVAEIPLLFETSMEGEFDSTLTVVADPHLAEERFKGPSNDFAKRNALQMPLEEKMEKSQFIIYNNGSLDELKSQVKQLYNQLKKHES